MNILLNKGWRSTYFFLNLKADAKLAKMSLSHFLIKSIQSATAIIIYSFNYVLITSTVILNTCIKMRWIHWSVTSSLKTYFSTSLCPVSFTFLKITKPQENIKITKLSDAKKVRLEKSPVFSQNSKKSFENKHFDLRQSVIVYRVKNPFAEVF